MTQSQSQNQQSQQQDRASQPAGGGGAQPSAVSSETREQLDDTQQEQADYGTPRGPAAGEAGENLTPTGADIGAVVNGLDEDRETPQPEQQEDPRRQGNFASDTQTNDDEDDSAIGMNGE